MKSMFRTQDIVLIAVMVATAGATYKIKHDAQDRLDEISKLQRDIRFQEDSIELLKADWSLLTQPSRLQKLTEAYAPELALQPLGARQIVSLADIPAKPPASPDALATDARSGPAAGGAKSGLAAGAKDQIKTGAIAR